MTSPQSPYQPQQPQQQNQPAQYQQPQQGQYQQGQYHPQPNQYQPNQYQSNQYQQPGYPSYQSDPNGSRPGKGAATGSLVCGIIGVVLWFFGWSSIVSVILGVVGLVLASNAKKAGFNEGLRTAGFVLSLLSLIFGGVIFIACVACVGSLGVVSMY